MGQGLGHKEHRCAELQTTEVETTRVCMYVIYEKHYSMWKACARVGHQYDQDQYNSMIQYNTGHQYDKDHYTGHQYDHTSGNTHPPITQSVM